MAMIDSLLRWLCSRYCTGVIDQQRLTIEDQRIVIAALRVKLNDTERERDELFALL